MELDLLKTSRVKNFKLNFDPNTGTDNVFIIELVIIILAWTTFILSIMSIVKFKFLLDN